MNKYDKVLETKSALKWVGLARQMSKVTDMRYEIRVCRKHLERAELTPEDIGSSEAELERLKRTSLKAEALFHLKWAREWQSVGDTDETLGSILTCMDYLERAELTPIAIGSSTEETEELKKFAEDHAHHTA